MRCVLLMLALLLAACTPSLHPLYTEQDAVFDPALLGSWKEADGKDRFIVTRAENGAYHVVYIDEDASGAFTARLVQLGGYRFVGLYPDDPQVGNGFYRGHLVKAHTFGRIWLEGDHIRIGLLDPDWFQKEQSRTAVLQRTLLDKTLIATAPTPELREFALKYAETKAFGALSQWVRER